MMARRVKDNPSSGKILKLVLVGGVAYYLLKTAAAPKKTGG